MASDYKMMRVTAQQPNEDDDQLMNPFTVGHSQIRDLISATHINNDEKFDADSLFVVVKNTLRRSAQIVGNVLLQGQEYLENNLEEKLSRLNFDPLNQLSYEGEETLENLDENVSTDNFNPLLCTLKQLFSEAPDAETAHKTTISILKKLSRYSWDAKAVLTLAAFALDYEDFLALAQLHSSHQPVESTLKHLDLKKYGKTMGELNKTINDMLDLIETIFEVKKLSNSDTEFRSSILHVVDPVAVYWIIITVVACTTQMCCLKSDKDKAQELLPFAQKISQTNSSLRTHISIRDFEIVEMKTRRKLKELLQTHDEITEVLKALVFAKDDMQPLIDGSTNKMVSIDVMKKKNALLLVSGLDISMDDISILKSIYDGLLSEKRYDEYKIVWIPLVEQWTDVMKKKFEMLRSKMPWYIVQYFSPLAGIKFIKEEWHLENEPIVVMMDLQGDVFNKNALHLIRDYGMHAFPFTGFIRHAFVMHPPGPYAIEEYTFFCGGNDNRWIEQFSKKVNVLAEDPITKEAYMSIELSCVGKIRKHHNFWKSKETRNKTQSKPQNPEIQKLLLSFKNESKWAVLTKWSTRVVSDHGTTILKVLDAFEEWKVNVPQRGFDICFKEYHDKFRQTGPLPMPSTRD